MKLTKGNILELGKSLRRYLGDEAYDEFNANTELLHAVKKIIREHDELLPSDVITFNVKMHITTKTPVKKEKDGTYDMEAIRNDLMHVLEEIGQAIKVLRPYIHLQPNSVDSDEITIERL